MAVVKDGARRLQSWSKAIGHLLERLSEALELCGDAGRQWRLQSWRADLENKVGVIDPIASFLRFHRVDPSANEKREKLEGHIRMRYRKMLLRGLPIGNGVTESASKTLVNMRARGSGQRCCGSGLRGTLNLGAINASDRFDAFRSIFARMDVANVNNCVAAG